MQTDLAKQLGIEFPIFAFTHCRDVVVAVSKAGGFGVLGAVGFTPEQLETELTWIDEHIGDLPYGVDIVIPGKYEGMGEGDAEKLEQELKDLIPEQHRKFADDLLDSHGVPEIPEEERMQELLGWTEATAGPQVQVALAHPKVKLLANALGTPPPDVIEEIHRLLPDTHLVMHGSSSVPEELQEIINKYGGQMKPTWGVPVEEIQRGIKHGVRKINIDTDNRMALTGAIRKVFAENPSEFDPRKYLKPAMDAMRKLCIERFEQFGTAGHAEKIKPLPLSEMAKRYKSGSLDPKTA